MAVTHEESEITAMVHRYATLDAESGKKPRAYVSLYTGTTSSKARKATANVGRDP